MSGDHVCDHSSRERPEEPTRLLEAGAHTGSAESEHHSAKVPLNNRGFPEFRSRNRQVMRSTEVERPEVANFARNDSKQSAFLLSSRARWQYDDRYIAKGNSK